MKSSDARTPRTIASVFVLDDDEAYCSLCVEQLAPRKVGTAKTIQAGLARLRTEAFDIALIDLFVDEPTNSSKVQPFAWGIDVIAQLRAERSDFLMVLVSGGTSLAFADEAAEHGANATVPKQYFSPRSIIGLIEEGRLEELETSCRPRKVMSLARHGREYLSARYLGNRRNAAETARELEISRSTFYTKLKKWEP